MRACVRAYVCVCVRGAHPCLQACMRMSFVCVWGGGGGSVCAEMHVSVGLWNRSGLLREEARAIINLSLLFYWLTEGKSVDRVDG